MNHRTKRMFAGAAVILMVACALFAVTFSDDEDVDAADSHTNKTGSNVSGTVGSSINSTVYTHSTVITSSVFQRYSVEQHNLPSSLGLSFSLSHSNNKMSLKLTGTPQENYSGTYSCTFGQTNNAGDHIQYTVTGNLTITGGTVSVTSVSISGSSSAEVDDVLTYTASVQPSNADNKAVTWSISSGSASITTQNDSSCSVRFTGEGTVVIKATADDGSGASDTFSVSVTDPEVLVTSVSIDGATTVEVGDSERYDVSVYPSDATDDSISWSVSNTSRATITTQTDSYCRITFNSAGTVTLYAYAQDGSGESDSIRINIEEPEVLVESVTISGSTTVDVGSSITLRVSVSPGDATNDGVTWRITSGTSYASITSQSDTSCTIRGTAAGSFTIRAEADDASGEYDTYTVTVQKPNQQFNLNFSYSPGSPGPQNQSWTERADTKTYTIPSTIPLRNDGYTFVQWNGSDGQNYDPGDRITLQPGTTTLTAQWEQTLYTSHLYYSAEGASNVPATDDYTGPETTDHEFTIDSAVPTKSGYVFLYWSCDSLRYDPGDKIDVPYNSSKTLTAMWETAQLDITSTPTVTGMVEGDVFSYRVTTNVEGCTVQVSGADWLSVSDGNLVSGTPTENGSYDITITVTKAGGYVSDTQQFTITVYSSIGFDSVPGAEGFYTYMND